MFERGLRETEATLTRWARATGVTDVTYPNYPDTARSGAYWIAINWRCKYIHGRSGHYPIVPLSANNTSAALHGILRLFDLLAS